jgi:hypothetical protein
MNDKVVFVATSELHPLPSVVVHDNAGNAAGSLLKIVLLSENVTVPVDPVSTVPVTLAEAPETKRKLATTASTRANANHEELRNVIFVTPLAT